MHVTSELSALGGRKNLFTEVDSCHFKAGFHRLVAWLVAIDTSSATKALVSFIESYVGFRLSSPGRSPLVDGGGIVDRYAPVTFAVDFTSFKKVLGTIFEVSLVLRNPQIKFRCRSSIFYPSSQLCGWGGAVNWRGRILKFFLNSLEIDQWSTRTVYPDPGNRKSLFSVSKIYWDPTACCLPAVAQKEPVRKGCMSREKVPSEFERDMLRHEPSRTSS